jgi:hypothetical protein
MTGGKDPLLVIRPAFGSPPAKKPDAIRLRHHVPADDSGGYDAVARQTPENLNGWPSSSVHSERRFGRFGRSGRSFLRLTGVGAFSSSLSAFNRAGTSRRSKCAG